MEICPLISGVSKGAIPVEHLVEAQVTAHQIRHALAAVIRMMLDDPKDCPNCDQFLPSHNAKCHVGLLLSRLN